MTAFQAAHTSSKSLDGYNRFPLLDYDQDIVGNSLNAGFFIIRNSMCQMPVVRYDDISIIVKLHLHLFINQEDIMHLFQESVFFIQDNT